MLIRDYSAFVDQTDWTKGRDRSERTSIAQYGIAAETGSLVSAVKKKLLVPSAHDWNEPNDEIIEELGDIVWYTAMLAHIDDGQSLTDILKSDLTALPREIAANEIFRSTLDAADYDRFVKEAALYVEQFGDQEFCDYQQIAFLTSRTKGRELLHVCLTRLLFYGTVMISKGFPQVEKLMQKDILDLPLERALGMIMWHVAAIATLYGKTLDQVAEFNISKLKELYNVYGENPTRLHDEGDEVPESQKLPRQFEVSFVTVGAGRLQMYYDGKRLGDELTDNSRKDDGYRFHDIMHLANAAKLGWSPVLRKLMNCKRKFSPIVDDSEDGARAQIVEEAVVKAIHSEGERICGLGVYNSSTGPATLFTAKEQIPFSFLKLIKSFVRGLEVERNRLWEWQEAIVEGHKIYSALHKEGQGTVRLDLNTRSITFDPCVSPALKGAVVGTGIGQAEIDPNSDSRCVSGEANFGDEAERSARTRATKAAILTSLGLSTETLEVMESLEITELPNGEVSVKSLGVVQQAMWKKGAISFQTVAIPFSGGVLCYAIALGDLPSHY